MKSLRLSLLILAVLTVAGSGLYGQSSQSYRKTGIMNGNQVRTVFGNWGVIGQPATTGRRGAWRNDNDGYLGDVSLFVGGEIKSNGKVVHSVVTCPVARPTKQTDTSPSGKYWTFEPVNGYANPNGQKVAISNDPSSWPSSWPDKLADLNDPGWKGSWNGYFGKKISADLETYFVMDDNNDERFNCRGQQRRRHQFQARQHPPRPEWPRPRRRVSGRMQWSQFLAKDNIFWLYEINNTGTTTYDRAVFGMLVGTYVGVTSTEDYREYANDWSFYDVNTNITYTGDFADQRVHGKSALGGRCRPGRVRVPREPGKSLRRNRQRRRRRFLRVSGGARPNSRRRTSIPSRLLSGQQIVLINDDFSRTVFTIPEPGLRAGVHARDERNWIYPGKDQSGRGEYRERCAPGRSLVNPNAYDGVDNNFNGLIDENYFSTTVRSRRTSRGNTSSSTSSVRCDTCELRYRAGDEQP